MSVELECLLLSQQPKIDENTGRNITAQKQKAAEDPLIPTKVRLISRAMPEESKVSKMAIKTHEIEAKT